MLAGFRSRCTMPLSCAASSASAICRAMRERLADWHRSAREALGERVAFNELENERAMPSSVFEAVNSADVRVVERRQHPRFALEAGEALRIGLEARAGS